MRVTVYTPKNKLVDNIEARSVYLSGAQGDMQILDNHIPLLSSLRPGTLVVETIKGERINVDLDMGYIEFSDNKMTIVIEKTKLTTEELKALEFEAVSLKDKVIKDDEEITENEFLNKK